MTIDIDFLNELNRFNILLKKRVLSQFQGNRQSSAQGEGLVFKDFREYTPGDDIRNIDWKVYARTAKYYIKEFEEERNLILRVMLDRSKSMDFGKNIKKFEYGAMLGLGLGHVALKNNEKFEITTFADDLQIFSPQKSRGRLVNILQHLSDLNLGGKTQLQTCMMKYGEVIKSKSLLVLISDFLLDIEEIRETLHKLKKNEVIVIQVLDPSELKLNIYGNLFLKDSESDFSLKTFLSPRARNHYLRLLDDHSAQIRNICEGLGMNYLRFSTETPIFDAFTALMSRNYS